MDPALIALPFTALMTGGLAGFLAGSIVHERRSVRDRVTFELPEQPNKSASEVVAPPQAFVLPTLSDDAAHQLKARFDAVTASAKALGSIVVAEPPASAPDVRQIELATSAVRHISQALAELTRFMQDGPAAEPFPLDEDVEVMLAKALQATVNILLAYQPSDGDREELGQLEAALHKFITDCGA